ncbi:Protein kinase domain-containing protein [Pleurotus pulmonarius]
MLFRQLTCTSVILACAIDVFAAPAPARDPGNEIEARGWDSHMVLRYGNDLISESYHAAMLEARAPPKIAPRPIAKPVAKPIAKPQAKPVAPAKPPSKQPGPSKPPGKPTAPTKPPVGQGTPPPPTKPGQQQCGVRNGKGKRAFDPSCPSNTLTLGGVTRPITKVGDQGNSAVTYKVEGGWPDPTNGQILTAYAKTGKRPGVNFAEEAEWLRQTEQLLAEGTYDGHNFIVFHGVTGKVKIQDTAFFMTLYPLMQKGDLKACEAAVMKKIDLIVKEAQVYVDKFGILHTDIQPNNILWDQAGNDPTLIDWGQAKEEKAWTPAVEAEVKKQAEFSHLKGGEKLCHDLSGGGK